MYKDGIPRTAEFGCYLGHRLVQKGRNCHEYGEVLQRVKDELDCRKTRCLSRAG